MWCSTPFSYCEVFENMISPCCPGWMKPEMLYRGPGIKEGWDSELFVDIRESVNSGNLQKCCLGNCPHWGMVQERDGRGSLHPPLSIVRFSFDSTCNLRCKSCRDDFRRANPEEVQKRLDEVCKLAGEIKRLEMSGAGDPIASPVYRKFLQTLDLGKFKKLNQIRLHTNAQLLTESFWNTLPEGVQQLITSLEISIDAATKETYEKIRRGGKWEMLLENLDFLGKQKHIYDWEFDFVVQQDNYKEILDFYKFCVDFYDTYREYGHKSILVGYQELMWWDWAVSRETYESLRIDTDPVAAETASDLIKKVEKSRVPGVRIYHNIPKTVPTVSEVLKRGKLI